MLLLYILFYALGRCLYPKWLHYEVLTLTSEDFKLRHVEPIKNSQTLESRLIIILRWIWAEDRGLWSLKQCVILYAGRFAQLYSARLLEWESSSLEPVLSLKHCVVMKAIHLVILLCSYFGKSQDTCIFLISLRLLNDLGLHRGLLRLYVLIPSLLSFRGLCLGAFALVSLHTEALTEYRVFSVDNKHVRLKGSGFISDDHAWQFCFCVCLL